MPGKYVGHAGTISVDGSDNANAGTVNLSSTVATVLTSGSVINANGKGQSSSGGDIRVLSDMESGSTVVGTGASLQAKGGEISGDGGFIEVSAANFAFHGAVDTSAKNGNTGTFLLDPTTLTIVNGIGGDQDLNLPTISFGGANTAFNTVSEISLEALGILTNIVLQATDSITLNNLADNNLGLLTGVGASITLQTNNAAASGITFVDPNDTIQSGGGSINLTAGGAGTTLTVNAGNLTANTGTVTLQADEMALTGTVTGNGGVTLRPNTAGTAITLGSGTSGLNFTGAALDRITTGGTLTIGANSAPAAGSITVDAAVQASNATNIALVTGGDITFAASGALTSSGAVILTANSGAVIGNAASLTNVTANDLTITTLNGVGVANALETSVNTLSATASNADINISEANGLGLNFIDAGTGNVTLNLSAGALTDNNGGANNVVANNLTVTAPGGIGDVETIVNTLTATTTNADISINESNGLALNLVDAGTGNVTLTLSAGALTDNNGAAINIIANTTTLSASTGIGSSDALETAVSTLSVTNSTSGNIALTDADSVSVGGSNTGGGSIALTAGGIGSRLTVNAGGLNPNGGTIYLVGDEMAMPGAISAGAGNVNLQPNTTGTVITLGTGTGGLNLSDATLNQVSTTGTLQIGTATAGSITVDAGLNQGGKNLALVTGGDITFGAAGSLSTSGNVALTAPAGAIVGDAAVLTNVTANDLTITTLNGVGVNNALETSVNTLSATASNTNINISEANGLSLNLIDAGSGNVTLNLSAGALTDNNGAANNIVASGLNITASGGITDIETSVNTLTATTTNTDISINESNGLALNLIDESTERRVG